MKRVDLEEAQRYCFFVLAPNLIDTELPLRLIEELSAARKVVKEAKRLGYPPDSTRLDDAVEDYDALFADEEK